MMIFMFRQLRHTGILCALLVCIGCAAAESGHESGTDAIDSSGLRFDGIYQSSKQVDYWNYIRFYPDGTVISVGSTGKPADLRAWFHKDHEHVSRGTVRIQQKRISFLATSSAGVVEYEGTFQSTELDLKTHSRINGHRGHYIYHFVAW